MCGTCGCGGASAETAAPLRRRLVEMEHDVFEENAGHARRNRERLARLGVPAFNLVSSPGSGKTTLLERTIALLRGRLVPAVIEGDQQTARDAERIAAAGARAVQINTGKGCHLDALRVGQALGELDLERGQVVFIENVGNLVCPADFDLGETSRVVLLSVTEGEDKPLKYPSIFAGSQLLLVTKIDLLPHLDFRLQDCLDHARAQNPALDVILLSSRTGAGMEAWLAWIAARAAAAAKV